MDNKPKVYCVRPCKNTDCELNRCKIPSDIYVEKTIYPFCKKFISDK